MLGTSNTWGLPSHGSGLAQRNTGICRDAAALRLETASDTRMLAEGASTLLLNVPRVFIAEFVSLELDGRDIHLQPVRGAGHRAFQFVGAVEEWPGDGDVPAEISSHGSCHNPADRTATLSDRRGGAYRSCRALGRNRLTSSGVAFDLGELPPSQRQPITGHKAVYGCPTTANGHLRADRIGLTGDPHHWDEESYDPKSFFHWDFVGHRFARDRIGSAPDVSEAADEIDARRELAVATTYEMEVGES